jgi:transposase
MFVRQKKSGERVYLQVVENRWAGGRVRQRVVATLGRLDLLRESGQLDGLIESASRFSEALLVISAHKRGELPTISTEIVGPALVFERLWKETGCQSVIQSLLGGRNFEFPVERAVFMTVLHRLLVSGSDRSAEKWRREYRINGSEMLELHHLYRAMAWLGDVLPPHHQAGRTPFSPRCTKDRIEEGLFAYRRDLFTSLDLVFFDTTSIYFEGKGGTSLGRNGNSKDHRPDLKQMVVGAVLDGQGRPICCELWPGNTSDVKTLMPVVDRLRRRFSVGRVCIVADRGMFDRKVMEEIEEHTDWQYILGARMRRVAEVRDDVLSRPGAYREVRPPGKRSKDPGPLKVKEVHVGDKRYVVCLNMDQKKKDQADRAAILASLRDQLKRGAKSFVGNKGYRRYLENPAEGFEIDEAKVREEARYDGKWVLQTNTDLDAAEVALKYMQLWMVESIFRDVKSLLETRPIFHKRDETIRGHVFCSFLALVLRKELQDRLAAHGEKPEWADVVQDLKALTITTVVKEGKTFRLRSEAQGTAGKVFQAAGVAMPPTVSLLREAAAS